MRIIGSGTYVTNNNWGSVKAAIGKYIYKDPTTQEMKATMGVLAETIVGKFILGETLGIYNNNDSLTFDANGLKITNGINTFTVNPNDNSGLLKISKGSEDIFYVDNNGNLNMTGTINANRGTIGGFTINDTYLAKNTTSLCGNDNSVYIGIDGISCGKNIQILKSGQLIAKYNLKNVAQINIGTFKTVVNENGLSVALESSDIGSLLTNTIVNYDRIYIEPIDRNYIGNRVTLESQSLDFFYGNDSNETLFSIGMYLGTNKPFINYYGTEPIKISKVQFIDDVYIGNYPKYYWKSNGSICVDSIILQDSQSDSPNFLIENNTISNNNGKIVLDCSNLDVGTILNDNDIAFRPLSKCADSLKLGTASNKFGQIYSSNSAISTSDKNFKKDITPLDEKYLQLFLLLQPVSYLFKNGTSGRTHIGFISQDVEEAMIKCGISDLEFAGFCKDVKKKYTTDENGDEIESDDLDENGNVQYIYSLRYEEFIGLITKAVQVLWNKMEELKNEINSI